VYVFIKKHQKPLLKHNKFGLIISQGSAATCLRNGGERCMSSVSNFILFLAVKFFRDPLRFGQVTASLNPARFEDCVFWEHVSCSAIGNLLARCNIIY